jgi:hypothetical protein
MANIKKRPKRLRYDEMKDKYFFINKNNKKSYVNKDNYKKIQNKYINKDLIDVDLNIYNKLKSLETSVKNVKETDPNFQIKRLLDKNLDRQIIEDKIIKGEDLTKQEEKKLLLFSKDDKEIPKQIDELKDIEKDVYILSPDEEKNKPIEPIKLNNPTDKQKKQYEKEMKKYEKDMKQYLIPIYMNNMANRMFNKSFNKNIIDAWNGYNNGSLNLIRDELFVYLYIIYSKKSLNDLRSFLIYDYGGKLMNLFGLSSKDDEGNIYEKILNKITPYLYNKLVFTKNGYEPIKNPGLIGRNNNLIRFEKKNKLSPLYENQIIEYYSGNDKFLGVKALDEIDDLELYPPEKLFNGSFIIYNTANRNEKGEHWCAIYMDPWSIEHYDPLAYHTKINNVIKSLKPILNKTNNLFKLKMNDNQNQDPETSLCGYHCIDFINKKINGMSFREATNYQKNSDEITEDIKKRFKLV